MLNINELENRWKIYKIKSYIPHVTILVSLLIIVTVILFVLNTNDKKAPLQKEIKKVIVQKQETPKPIIKKKIKNTIKNDEAIKPIKLVASEKKVKIKPVQHKEEKTQIITTKKNIKTKVLISPSLDFMKNMQNNTLGYYAQDSDQERRKKAPKRVSSNQLKEIKQEQKKTINIIKKSTSSNGTRKSISINRQNNYEDINHVIKRFQKNNNPALSLFVARKYYELGKYKKSYNYALITNNINNEIEASWIIFAKSLIKLKKKEQAKKVLQKYIDRSFSNRAKILLDDINTGEFK